GGGGVGERPGEPGEVGGPAGVVPAEQRGVTAFGGREGFGGVLPGGGEPEVLLRCFFCYALAGDGADGFLGGPVVPGQFAEAAMAESLCASSVICPAVRPLTSAQAGSSAARAARPAAGSAPGCGIADQGIPAAWEALASRAAIAVSAADS